MRFKYIIDGKEFITDKEYANREEFLKAVQAANIYADSIDEYRGTQAKSAPEPAVKKREKPAFESAVDSILNQIYAAPAAIYAAPAVIAEGVKRNPAGVLGGAALRTAFPNAVQAANEGKTLGILPSGLLDISSLLLSPMKALKLGAKLMPLPQKLKSLQNLAAPTNKTTSLGKNLKRNVLSEAITGSADNLFYEAIADAMDNRDHTVGDYLFAGGLGGLSGGVSGAMQTKAQAKAVNNYGKWSAANNYKQKIKENIRNAQNNTESNLETFSFLVNSSHPFATTSALRDKAKKERESTGKALNNYKNSNIANEPLKNSTLSDFQAVLEDKLYNDNSGNLTLSEANSVLKNFYDDAVNLLIKNSSSLKKYMEVNSKAVLGHPRAYLDNKEFQDLAMQYYNLTANDMNILRSYDKKTTLTIPSKPGYVRAGEDNINYHQYADLFKKEIENNRGGKTAELNKLNKEWSRAKNQEEIVEQVLEQQGKGGITDYHFPYFEMNPEINPTVIGNNPLKVRNLMNTAASTIDTFEAIPEEAREDYRRVLAALVADAKKLGLKTEEEINKYVASRLEGATPPSMEIIGSSVQRSGDR